MHRYPPHRRDRVLPRHLMQPLDALIRPLVVHEPRAAPPHRGTGVREAAEHGRHPVAAGVYQGLVSGTDRPPVSGAEALDLLFEGEVGYLVRARAIRLTLHLYLLKKEVILTRTLLLALQAGGRFRNHGGGIAGVRNLFRMSGS